MGPPLSNSKEEVDCVGTAELSEGEIVEVRTFVDERQSEYKAQKDRLRLAGVAKKPGDFYVICPAVTRPDKDTPFMRYSCAGLVMFAYLRAGIQLLSDDIPEVDLSQIVVVDSRVGEMSEQERIGFGIGVGNSWPVVFVGYLMKSLARTAIEIRSTPYSPVQADIQFVP